MNFLKSLGKVFVESEESGNFSPEYLAQLESLQQQSIPEIEVNIEAIEGLLTIEEIYKQNNVADLAKTIYKVEEIKSVLPNNLPNDAKKSSVEGMMKVSGLDKDQVIVDAENRIAILNSVDDMLGKETLEKIESNQAKITELENQINELNTQIINAKKLKEEQEATISSEIEKINKIIEFIK